MMKGRGLDVGDVVQDTLLEAYLHLGSIRGGSASVTPWIRRVAYNMVCRYFRKEYRRGAIDLDDLLLMQQGGDPLALEKRRDLRHAVLELTEAEAKALILHHVEQHSLREVAQMLSLSESTTKRRLKSARASIRRKLTQEPRTHLAPPPSLN